MIELAGAPERPRLCYLGTATGDDPIRLGGVYGAFAGSAVEVSHLSLFTMPTVPDMRAHLLAQDVVWVGGGSVANLLAVWRVHDLDEIFREVWEAGVVLGGVSAGSICWHVGGTTDSFGPDLRPVTNGLGAAADVQRRALRLRGAAPPALPPARRPTARCPAATPPTTASAWSTAAPSWWRSSPTGRTRPATAWNAAPDGTAVETRLEPRRRPTRYGAM